jgi:hypothetical protein
MRALSCSSAIGLVFLATAVRADVTPQEVWANWQAMMTAAGQELTVGNTADSGASIEATDVAVTYKDQLGGSASFSFDHAGQLSDADGVSTAGRWAGFDQADGQPA